MIDKDEVYQETRIELEKAIIKKLFELPAFRLDSKKARVLETYLLTDFNNNISSNKYSSNSYIFNNINRKNKAKINTELYYFKGAEKRITTILAMLPIRTKIYFVLSLLFSIVGYFSIQQDYIIFQLVGLMSVLGFILSFYLFCLESSNVYQLVANTFAYLNKTLKVIKNYSDSISITNKKQQTKITKEKIKYFSNKIVREFINQEIRHIDFNLKEIYLFPIIFAFSNSFFIVYVLGDKLVIAVKELARLTNLIDAFPILHNFNLQTFWIFCFSFSIALGRYLKIQGSQKYSDKLHQSIFLLDLNNNNEIQINSFDSSN